MNQEAALTRHRICQLRDRRLQAPRTVRASVCRPYVCGALLEQPDELRRETPGQVPPTPRTQVGWQSSGRAGEMREGPASAGCRHTRPLAHELLKPHVCSACMGRTWGRARPGWGSHGALLGSVPVHGLLALLLPRHQARPKSQGRSACGGESRENSLASPKRLLRAPPDVAEPPHKGGTRLGTHLPVNPVDSSDCSPGWDHHCKVTARACPDPAMTGTGVGRGRGWGWGRGRGPVGGGVGHSISMTWGWVTTPPLPPLGSFQMQAAEGQAGGEASGGCRACPPPGVGTTRPGKGPAASVTQTDPGGHSVQDEVAHQLSSSWLWAPQVCLHPGGTSMTVPTTHGPHPLWFCPGGRGHSPHTGPASAEEHALECPLCRPPLLRPSALTLASSRKRLLLCPGSQNRGAQTNCSKRSSKREIDPDIVACSPGGCDLSAS